MSSSFYLCPLQLNARSKDFPHWIDQVLDDAANLIQIQEDQELYGYGREFIRQQTDGTSAVTWTERVLLIKSVKFFEAEKMRFDKALNIFKEKLLKVKSKLCKTAE